MNILRTEEMDEKYSYYLQLIVIILIKGYKSIGGENCA